MNHDQRPWTYDFPDTSDLAAQCEYARCMTTRPVIKFTAHGDAWHWYVPSTDTAYSRLRRLSGLSREVIVTKNAGLDWIKKASAAIAKRYS